MTDRYGNEIKKDSVIIIHESTREVNPLKLFGVPLGAIGLVWACPFWNNDVGIKVKGYTLTNIILNPTDIEVISEL